MRAYAGVMAGKDIDRIRGRSALETVRENPVIAGIALLPVVAVFGVVWWLLGFFPALLLLLVFGGVVVWKGKLLG
ncbi:Uncharacterised protein [Nocardia otitidiscaviarum]|uniref:Uncharacterized protein n=2 Tax=Nocardia otitidiscaviarum TaxID=1823 RepID=A0A378YAM9_9NOCA|nr:Uncharacterised protein [Nocardia otitidiscaviarum]